MKPKDQKQKPRFKEVRNFWENNPLGASKIEAVHGSHEFFKQYDQLREVNESISFARSLHEYDRFKGKRVLEVGCGNAYTLDKYARNGSTVYGLDATFKAVIISRKRFNYNRLQGNFVVGNAEELPYKSDSFDCICSMGVLHHVPEPEKAVSEIYRCLKPGGRLIVMFYHRNSILYRIGMPIRSVLTGKSLMRLVNEVDGLGNPKGEVYSKRELRNLLSKFNGVEMFCGLLQPSILRSILPSPVVELLGKKWGWFLYAKGRK